MSTKSKKVILAYSGGLDTTYCLIYLQKQGYDVVTATINTGGFSGEELNEIETKAHNLGSLKHITIDGCAAIWDYADFIIKGEYLRGGVYPICVAPERCAIVPELLSIARDHDTNLIAHGSTGAGGDQVRFDNALKAFMPEVEIIAPIREQSLTREQTANYLAQYDVQVSSATKDYSLNIGLLGTSIGGKETLDTLETLPEQAFPHVKPLGETPDKAVVVEVGLKAGSVESLNGESFDGVSLITKLNEIGAEAGFGKGYHIGTSLLGVPARLGFEAPGMLALIEAHKNLAKVVLTKEEHAYLKYTGELFGELVHSGRFYHPVINAYKAALNALNERMTGIVTLKFFKGHLSIEKIESTQSRFGMTSAKYGEEIDVDGKAMAQICQMFDNEGILVAQAQSSAANTDGSDKANQGAGGLS